MAESHVSLPRSGTPMFITLLVILAATTLLFVFARTPSGDQPGVSPETAPGVGQKLDELRLEPLIGESQPLTSDNLRGKVALVSFWGTWCPPCRMEMPSLVKLRNRYFARSDFQFVSVSCSASLQYEDVNELRRDTAEYLKSEGYDFPVYSDPRGQSRLALVEVAQLQDEGFAYPLTLILDRQGTIRALWVGYSPNVGDEMGRELEKLLGTNSAPGQTD